MSFRKSIDPKKQATDLQAKERNKRRLQKMAEKREELGTPSPEHQPAHSHAEGAPAPDAPKSATQRSQPLFYKQPNISAFVTAPASQIVDVIHVFTRKMSWEVHSPQGFFDSLISAVVTELNATKTNDAKTRNAILHHKCFLYMKSAIISAIKSILHSAYREYVPFPSWFEQRMILADALCPPCLTNVVNAFSPLEGCYVINAYDMIVKLTNAIQDLNALEIESRNNNYATFDNLKTVQGWKHFSDRLLFDADVIYVQPGSRMIESDFVTKRLKGFKLVTHEPANLHEFQQVPPSIELTVYRPSWRVRKFAMARIDAYKIKCESQYPLLGGEVERVNAIYRYKYYDYHVVDREFLNAVVNSELHDTVVSAATIVKSVNEDGQSMTRSTRSQQPRTKVIELPQESVAPEWPNRQTDDYISELSADEVVPQSNEAKLLAAIRALSIQYNSNKRQNEQGHTEYEIERNGQDVWIPAWEYYVSIARATIRALIPDEEENHPE